nr:MAG TPA: hypothetical protein [Caudoviricetes sp.]
MATKVTNTTEKVEVVETEKKAAVNVLDLYGGLYYGY